MTNATKTLATIFVVLSVVTVGITWSSGPDASEAFRSDLIEADTSEVNKIVIKHPTNPTITLSKDDQQWLVSSGSTGRFPADGSSIKSAITQLNDLSVNAVATRNPDKFTRYKVDSTGTKVSLYNDDNLINSVFVGAPQQQGRRSFNSYVRLANEDAVYSVEGFLQPRFAKKIEDWRDKTVWDVEQSNISRVDFLYPADSSFSITKTGPSNWVSEGDTLSGSEVRPVLNQLASPRASGFPDSPSKDNFGVEKYAIQIELSGGEQHRIRLKESTVDTTTYIGISSDSPYVFNFSRNTWDDNVLKSRSELLQSNDE